MLSDDGARMCHRWVTQEGEPEPLYKHMEQGLCERIVIHADKLCEVTY